MEFPNGSIDEKPNVVLPKYSILAFTSAYPRPANALQGEAVLQAFVNAQYGTPHILPGINAYVPVMIAFALELGMVGLAVVQARNRKV